LKVNLKVVQMTSESNKVIYTIGYSGRKINDLISILKSYNINLLVDVRRWPTSKVDDYKKENLKIKLSEAGINYIWLGDKLGGYRSSGYEAYMNTNSFKEGIKKLIELSKSNVICIFCLERKPKYCHRRFIAGALEERGFKVYHII